MFVKINITELINGGNPIWEDLINSYNEVGVLNKRDRKAIIDAIILHARIKKMTIPDDSMYDISCQLHKIFPTEISVTFILQSMDRSQFHIKKNQTTYYYPKEGKKPSGILYNRYHNSRRGCREEQKQAKKENIEEIFIEPTGLNSFKTKTFFKKLFCIRLEFFSVICNM